MSATTTISSLLGLYAGGCVSAMVFFCTGRWPSLLERDWHWPVIFLWPLVVLWPLRRLAHLGAKTGGGQPQPVGRAEEKK